MQSLANLFDVVRQDDRYPYEAYVFVFEGLAHTQRKLGRGIARDGESPEGSDRHVSGPEMVAGMIELAREQFGMLARTVFRMWGIRRTDDIGELVFRLIEGKLLSKTDSDSRDDFHELYDLDEALGRGYSINLEDVSWGRPNRG